MPRADAPGLGAQEDRCRPSTCGVCDSGGLLVCLAAPCARFFGVWSHAPQILCLSRPRHLLRPSDATRRRVGRRAEAAGLRRAPRPLLGIHVRRGDSCREVQEATKARRCSPFAEYWYHALAMRARGGVQAFISAVAICAAGALRHPVRIPRNRRSLRRRRGSDSGHNRRSAALRHARQSAGQRRHRTAPTLGFSARPCQTQFRMTHAEGAVTCAF